jgi:hypothetical protein
MIGILAWTTAVSSLSAGEKEAKEILERAIKAHGGTKALTKAAQLERRDKGTQGPTAFTSKVVRSLPDRVRLTIVHGETTTTVVLNGNKGWKSDGGPAEALEAPRLKELREEAYVDWIATLVPLTKTGFTLSTLPKTKVSGEQAVGIKVVHKGSPDVRLYFLQRNGLLAKIQFETKRAGLAVEMEYLFSAFKEFSGVKLPTRRTELINGKKFTEYTSSDVSFPAKIDAKTFAKP